MKKRKLMNHFIVNKKDHIITKNLEIANKSLLEIHDAFINAGFKEDELVNLNFENNPEQIAFHLYLKRNENSNVHFHVMFNSFYDTSIISQDYDKVKDMISSRQIFRVKFDEYNKVIDFIKDFKEKLLVDENHGKIEHGKNISESVENNSKNINTNQENVNNNIERNIDKNIQVDKSYEINAEKEFQEICNAIELSFGKGVKFKQMSAHIKRIDPIYWDESYWQKPEIVEKVEQIKERFLRGDPIPPFVVDIINGERNKPYCIVDGLHRMRALESLGYSGNIEILRSVGEKLDDSEGVVDEMKMKCYYEKK